MNEAAGMLIAFPAAERRCAEAFRREAALDESAAQMLRVEDLIAKRDPSALAQARILVSQAKRIAGENSPAVAIANGLLARASDQRLK